MSRILISKLYIRIDKLKNSLVICSFLKKIKEKCFHKKMQNTKIISLSKSIIKQSLWRMELKKENELKSF